VTDPSKRGAQDDPGELAPESGLLPKIPIGYSRRHLLLPCRTPGGEIVLLSGKPEAREAIDEMRFLAGAARIVSAPPDEVLARIDAAYERAHSPEREIVEGLPGEWDLDPTAAIEETRDLLESPDEAPVIRFVHSVLFRAIRERSSDIHFEPYEKELVVRNRVDGILYPMITAPRKWHAPAVSRVKVMAGLDIAERRLTQDGRIKLKMGTGGELDIRVSILPTLFGEKVVMRLLDKSNLQLDMAKLGFDPQNLKDFQDAIHKPYGMILITGPTGSGKSTTLYSALSELNKPDVNISTAEDPVEYNLMGINQVQVREQIGLNFAAALRSFLRQDPDILMVGEIRDLETAQIAIKAALTGHLVLSTLHTNDCPATVDRLINMGVETFLLTSSINLILAQRLVRKICDKCKEPVEIKPEVLINLGVDAADIGTGFPTFHGKGCANCAGTGYRGRLAVYEVMVMHEALKELIIKGVSSMELKREAVKLGMSTLRMSALQKVRDGFTTVDETIRVTDTDKGFGSVFSLGF